MHRAPFALLIALTVAACGGTAPPATSPTIETGVVGGRVLMPSASGADVGRLIVSLVGAPLSANVGSLGDFVLANVPAGPLALHFTGEGIATGLDAGAIAGGETVSLVVRLDSTAARVDSVSRVRGNDAMVEGPIEAPPATLPPNTIIVGGRTVLLPEGTARLTPGMRVRITGTVSAAGIIARDIVIQ